jgi:prolyl oligopeptidase
MRRLFVTFRHPLIALALLCALAVLTMPASAALPRPPASAVHNVQTTYFGVTVDDPYRWLEPAASSSVSKWIDAQNDYAARVFATFKGAATISSRLRQLALSGPQQFDPKIASGNLFYLREVPPAAQPVLAMQTWPALGERRVLVDPNPAGGLVSIEGYWPSPDGKYVAYATQEAGAERTSVHVVDVASGAVLPDVLPWMSSGTSTDAVAWDADSRGFAYTRMPIPAGSSAAAREIPWASYFHSSLYHHRLGASPSSDTAVLTDGSPVAEWNAMNGPDGVAVAMVHDGDGSYATVYARRRDGSWRKHTDASANVLVGSDDSRVTSVAVVGNRLMILETAGAPRGKVVAFGDGAGPTVVYEPSGAWSSRSIVGVAGGFLSTEVNGADWRVQHVAVNGSVVRTLALPAHGVGIGAVAAEAGATSALVEYDGWVIPQRWVRYDVRSGSLTQIYALKPAADYSQVEFSVMYATSKDGTRVPYTVLRRKGMAANGSAPGILTAYGGYGLETAPGFIGSILAWIESGGVYAEANIRGGGEYGEDWHLNGRLTTKQNDYDDFAACARAFIDSGWVAPGRLGIVGGSNGGLLMGAAMTQHPELYRAVVSFAGDYDMLRVEDSPNGQYNMTEFGTVRDEAQFKALLGYSPYHNVHDGTVYPAVLMIAGENDPRVPPWESRKMIARLQAANKGPNPIMLITRREAGHGIGASFSQRLGDRSAEWLFFANELGLAVH